MLENIRDFWGIIVAGVSAIAWLLRIESKAAANTREIERLWKQRHEDLASAKEARDNTNELLREVRADIKALLQRRDRE